MIGFIILAIFFLIFTIHMLFKYWYGSGTEDDKRNPFWRLTEYLSVKVEWSVYLIDLRLGFKREGKWKCLLEFLKPVEYSFNNGILTFNIYIIKTTLWNWCPMIIPRINVVIRPLYNWYFEFGVGYLAGRGEFGFKCVVYNWEKENAEAFANGNYKTGDAKGWEEGSV